MDAPSKQELTARLVQTVQDLAALADRRRELIEQLGVLNAEFKVGDRLTDDGNVRKRNVYEVTRMRGKLPVFGEARGEVTTLYYGRQVLVDGSLGKAEHEIYPYGKLRLAVPSDYARKGAA